MFQKSNVAHSGNLEWHDFEGLCSTYFDNQITISRSLSKEDQTKETKLAIEKRQCIFGGYFQSSNFSSYIECLVPSPESNSWELYDFRPVSSNKLDIIRSLYFQKKLLESLDISIIDTKLIRINASYIFDKSPIDRDEYLIVESVTDRLTKESLRFENEWDLFLNYLENPIFPIHEDTHHTCRSPKSCYSKDVCFKEISDYEIFDLREGQELTKKFYLNGIKTFSEMPEDELSQIQLIQKRAHVNSEDYFDTVQLKTFFEGVSDKVAFLDFESINPILPMFPNSKPFQHIPFLYSLHIWDSTSDTLIHHSYIHKPEDGDPRYNVINQLMKDIPKETTIFSFNDFFEKQIIDDLVNLYAEHSELWTYMKPLFKDLALPFKKFWIYSPKQKGKASLKEILPAFSDISHIGLSIKEGQDANYQYLRLLKKQVTLEEKIRVLEDLETYCKMDTFGLFLLYKMLYEKLK